MLNVALDLLSDEIKTKYLLSHFLFLSSLLLFYGPGHDSATGPDFFLGPKDGNLEVFICLSSMCLMKSGLLTRVTDLNLVKHCWVFVKLCKSAPKRNGHGRCSQVVLLLSSKIF